MNDLYLIGNGFDLAHGLKTSYNDFLLWYLNKMTHPIFPEGIHTDNLTTIDKRNCTNSITECESIPKLFEEYEKNHIQIDFSHPFFEKIVKNYREYKWVDIEYEYYWTLVQIVKAAERNVYQRDIYLDMVKALNSCFVLIKKKLVEYLFSVQISSDLKNRPSKEILFEETGTPETRVNEQLKGLLSNEISNGEKLFVCFNYTHTMELYLRHSSYENNLIYIHGELDGTSNPIIFGYGDEMDPHYEKIENLNTNEFLKNIKSFHYFKSDNYQQVMRFVGSGDFTLKILGHSCGLSDRILLNTIFEHPNCKAIKIFHYEKSPTENDYFEKTQEISRHFKASGKGDMRMKIVPFNKYNSMPQVKKDN